ncbi:MAG: penicillin-binding protein 2 [Elusimicrobiota bacterium]
MRNSGSQERSRISIIFACVSVAVAALFLRLFELQIVDRADLIAAAERNRTEMIYQTAPRGSIYDRNGIVLATNRPMFSLIYLPSHKGLLDLRPLSLELAAQLHRSSSDILASLVQATRDDTVVRLAENLSPHVMFRLSELKPIYPGVDLVVESERYYPMDRIASHLIGYVGMMDSGDWRDLKSNDYRLDSSIGRMGIEKIFESVLRGRDGAIRMEVDAQGRLNRQLERIAWRPGNSLFLTVNANVQAAAEEGLSRTSSRRGAAVAIDPRDGSILALASTPDFNPNDLSGKAIPEFNRAISGTYAPGSVFKIVVGAAGLNEGRFNVKDTVFCPGYFKLGAKVFRCWNHKGHGLVDWWKAVAQSCDVYFYHMGLATGADFIEKYSALFGLGRPTRVALSGESSGRLFGPQSSAADGRRWFDGDTVNLSIGQGGLLVTPIQMADMIAAVANGGTIWRPHYIRRIEYSDGSPDYVQQPEKTGFVNLKPTVWDDIHEALRLVVSSGTGAECAIRGLDIRGKTGTAQNPLGRDHAWFVAYAARPGQAPSIAIAVLVENGGHGGSVAAPIARRMFMAAFGLDRRGNSHSAPPFARPMRPVLAGFPVRT